MIVHHGSKTSSSQKWIDQVAPRLVINSTARQNQWGLPNQAVVDRYRLSGALWLDTRLSGAIRVEFSPDGWRYFSQKNHLQPYWYRHLVGDMVRKE